MDLLIFGGQSNMEGRTEGLPVPNEAAPGVWEYKFLTDSIVPLVHPAGERILPDLDGASESFGSLVPDFCRVYRNETGREVLAVHAAKGATRIDEWLPGTDRYRTALKKILGAKRAEADRNQGAETVRQAGYDIRREARKLEEIYLDMAARAEAGTYGRK